MPKVFYRHERPLVMDDMGNVTVSGHGGVTIRAEELGTSNGNSHHYKVAFAIANESDNYCKATGRELADQRAEQPHGTLTFVVTTSSDHAAAVMDACYHEVDERCSTGEDTLLTLRQRLKIARRSREKYGHLRDDQKKSVESFL